MWTNKEKRKVRHEAMAVPVADADLARVEGGTQVAVLRLHAVVPEKVSVIPTANGFTVASNVPTATVTTSQTVDGTTVTVMGS
jgi:hypothetical protein